MKSNDSHEAKDYSFLETFESIDEEKDWQKVRAQMKQKRTIRPGTLWKVAAGILVLLGIGYLALQMVGGSPQTLQLTAVDQVREIALPDGSMVVLNRGTTLSWPEEFKGRRRRVSMNGEAWFEVKSNPARAFLVKVENRAQVEVLGTRFNIKADSLRNDIAVQVEEGRVAFSNERNQGDRLVLAAGQGAVMDRYGVILAEKVDPNELSWRTGILVFDQHSLQQVAEILEAYYGTCIELDPKITDELEFTSTIRNEELTAVLEELCLVLDLAYEKAGGKILLQPTP